MKTIIVDDEVKALDLLEFHLNEYFDDYQIVGRYLDVDSAFEGILKFKPQILFLDINMPSGLGIDLLSKIKHLNVLTIFLTAHSEYVFQAIKLSAFDYLLKPINLEELNRVDSKIREKLNGTRSFENGKIKIHISNNIYVFDKDDIICVQSEGNYSTIYSTNHKQIVLTKNLKKVQDEYFSELPFFRSHQSHLINVNHVISYSNVEIQLNFKHTARLSSKNYELLTKLID